LAQYIGNYYRDKQSPTGFTKLPPAGENKRISWGKPAQITEAIIDKHCPSCNKSQKQGFDIGIENGKIFGARCDCGFSF
jgi:hypothetical protein